MINIKRAVELNRWVDFVYYHDGSLWYETEFQEIFPVPIADIGNSRFPAKDRAILFMRYMRLFNQGLVDEQALGDIV